MSRILVAKLGLDGHDVGAKVLAATARDAGHKVIYLGIRQRPDVVARAAVDEDVDVIAISLLSGAHALLASALMDALGTYGCETPVVIGGLIPADDVDELLAQGIAAVAPSGTTPTGAVELINTVVGSVAR